MSSPDRLRTNLGRIAAIVSLPLAISACSSTPHEPFEIHLAGIIMETDSALPVHGEVIIDIKFFNVRSQFPHDIPASEPKPITELVGDLPPSTQIKTPKRIQL